MDGDHTLPWQGAYWALLAVALNSMSRPAGKINGMPADWTFYLRIGPVFCALDLTTTLGTFVYFVWRHRSVRYAALRVEAQRLYDTPDDFEGRPEKLKENAFLSCSGIVWVQVLCAIYLSTSLLDEAITAIAGLARSAGSRISAMDSEIFFPREWKNMPLLGLVEGILRTIVFNARLPVENWIGLLIVGVGVAFLTSDTSKPKNVAVFALSTALFPAVMHLVYLPMLLSVASFVEFLDRRFGRMQFLLYPLLVGGFWLCIMLLIPAFVYGYDFFMNLVGLGAQSFLGTFGKVEAKTCLRLHLITMMSPSIVVFVRGYDASNIFRPPWLDCFG